MKKFILGFLTAIIVCMATAVYADPVLQDITVQLNKSIKILYNNVEQNMTDANGVKVYPLTYNGTTYVPLRAVSNILGTAVNWNQDAYAVELGVNAQIQSKEPIKNEDEEEIFLRKLYEYAAFNEIVLTESDKSMPTLNAINGTMYEMLAEYSKYLNEFNEDDYKKIVVLEDLVINENEFLNDFNKYANKYSKIIQEWIPQFELSYRILKTYHTLYKDGLEMKTINNNIIHSGDTSLQAYKPLIDRVNGHADITKEMINNDKDRIELIETLYDKYNYPDSFIDSNSNFDEYISQTILDKKSFDIQKLYDELKK